MPWELFILNINCKLIQRWYFLNIWRCWIIFFNISLFLPHVKLVFEFFCHLYTNAKMEKKVGSNIMYIYLSILVYKYGKWIIWQYMKRDHFSQPPMPIIINSQSQAIIVLCNAFSYKHWILCIITIPKNNYMLVITK
jgi:hypothetical protein